MVSINAELEVIKLLEEELTCRNDEELKNQLECLKNLAYSIEYMIRTGKSDSDVHNVTNILCKYIGILWQNVFNTKIK